MQRLRFVPVQPENLPHQFAHPLIPRSKNTRIEGPAPLKAQPNSPGARSRKISCSPGTKASRYGW